MKHIVCIGHAKCGTSLLDSAFRMASGVAAPRDCKELRFFLPKLFPDEDAYDCYLSHYDLQASRVRPRITFEATPQYSHQLPDVFRKTIRNIAVTLDDAEILICFRQPVIRAYSHYIHNLQTFALYGEGVFSPRKDLHRRVCEMTFTETLSNTTWIKTEYSRVLGDTIEVFGSERVKLFFLEHDADDLVAWASRAFADDHPILDRGCVPDKPVYVRRPLPAYRREGRDLAVLDSLTGERMRYEGLAPETLDRILSSQQRWTLKLDEAQISLLTEVHFESDLRECFRMTGDKRFLDYIKPVGTTQLAQLYEPPLDQAPR
jgi:hypothetical protein